MADVSNQTDTGQVLPRTYDRDSQSLKTIDADDIENMDEASATVTYFGFARIGTADVSPAWRIYRREIIGTVTKIRWAEGSSAYVNIWSSRASLSYS